MKEIRFFFFWYWLILGLKLANPFLALDVENTRGDEEESPGKHIRKCVSVEDGP